MLHHLYSCTPGRGSAIHKHPNQVSNHMRHSAWLSAVVPVAQEGRALTVQGAVRRSDAQHQQAVHQPCRLAEVHTQQQEACHTWEEGRSP